MRKRYVVSENLPPEMKKVGLRFEVVDSTHPRDGGPEAVAWFIERWSAEQTAESLNLINGLTNGFQGEGSVVERRVETTKASARPASP